MKLQAGLFLIATMLAAPAARGQGAAQKTVVISEAALKTMSAHKPKKKMPLTARMAVKRQSTIKTSTADSAHFQPATVREITRTSRN